MNSKICKGQILAFTCSLFFGIAAGQHSGTYPITKECKGNPILVNFTSRSWDDPDARLPFYAADPSARVWKVDGKERLYLYASHDLEPARGCDRMDRYHIFSTDDMKHWTDHGEIFSSEEVNKTMGGWTVDGFMWAPDCMYNPGDGKYYYYFPHPKGPKWNDSWEIVVATSDRPDGGFKIVKAIDGMPGRIDPNIFLDDDGTCYIFVGGGAHFYGGKLRKDDWTTLDGEMKELTIANSDFHEGAWVFKKDGQYFLSYPDNKSPRLGGNQMRYATAPTPLGPWTEKGIYMNSHGEETAHGSIVNFKGKWYQFYHTGNYSGRGNVRSCCFDEITFDGNRINKVRNWGTAAKGLKPAGSGKSLKIEGEYFNKGGSHYGYFVRPENGTMKIIKEGKEAWISPLSRQEWTRYSADFKEAGMYTVTVRVKQSESNNGKFTIGLDGDWIHTSVPVGDKVDQWQEIRLENIPVPETGEHYIEFRGADGKVILDWLKIEKI